MGEKKIEEYKMEQVESHLLSAMKSLDCATFIIGETFFSETNKLYEVKAQIKNVLNDKFDFLARQKVKY